MPSIKALMIKLAIGAMVTGVLGTMLLCWAWSHIRFVWVF